MFVGRGWVSGGACIIVFVCVGCVQFVETNMFWP